MTTNKQSTSKIDYNLVFILFLLFISSCIAIYSAQTTGQYKENFYLNKLSGTLGYGTYWRRDHAGF